MFALAEGKYVLGFQLAFIQTVRAIADRYI